MKLPRSRLQRLAKVRAAVVAIEEELLRWRQECPARCLEANSTAFRSLYYLNRLARRSPL